MSRSWLGLAALALLAATGCQQEVSKNSQPTLKEIKKEVLEPGNGPVVAKGDTVYMEYTGRLMDGTEFDGNVDSDGAPYMVVLGAGMVIKGWDEGIVGMKVGEKAKLSIPAEKAYGPAGSPPKIPANADLQFDVKVLGALKKGEEALYDVKDDKVGTGAEAVVGKTAEIHYSIKYLNGNVADDSRKRGKTLQFKVGATDGARVVSGIDDGIRGMKVGGKRTLTLPPGLVFGPSGGRSLSGNQIIIVTMDLISVK